MFSMANKQKISSKQNSKIKFVAKLRDRGKRNRAELFIVEGFRECFRAFGSGISFEFLFFCPKFFRNENFDKFVQRVAQEGVDVFELSEDVFQKVSIRDNCDGILAVCKTWQRNLGELKFHENSLFLVVDGIEKSGNLGALMRSAESVNVDAMFVCNPVTDIFNHNVVRTSQGALFSLAIFQAPREEIYNILLRNNISILATSPSALTRYWEVDMRASSAIVVGSEHDGLPEFWLRNDRVTTVSIPQLGHSDSLNVNDAAAIVLYDALRQRLSQKG
jgi:TrmH family RNA methyltransferase